MSRYSNIFVDQGASYTEVIDLNNNDGSIFDLTNFTVVAKAKKHSQSTAFVSFATALDIIAGKVTISLTIAQTTALDPVKYIYDVMIVNTVSGIGIKIVEGTMIVSSTSSL